MSLLLHQRHSRRNDAEDAMVVEDKGAVERGREGTVATVERGREGAVASVDRGSEGEAEHMIEKDGGSDYSGVRRDENI